MQLLLLLSALLSALTGAVSGGRVPESRCQQVCGAGTRTALAVPTRAVPARPQAFSGTLPAARPRQTMVSALVAAPAGPLVPLYLGRLRL